MRHLARTTKTAWLLMAAAVLTGCADALTDDSLQRHGNDTADADIVFCMNVEDVCQQQASIGQTRASHNDSHTPTAHTLQGDNAIGTLYATPLQLPALATTPRATTTALTASDHNTRASIASIVKSGGYFPDSVTIFGYAYNKDGDALKDPRYLFSETGTLLKHIRDWRSSVHWPYDRNNMRFFSLAPCSEHTDITMKQVPIDKDNGMVQPLKFTYTVPDDIGRQRDLLFGASKEIDVQAGPQGNNSQRDSNLGKDNKTIGISYRHILTAIRFARGTLPKGFRITNIRLENIANEGTYTATTNGGDGTWTMDTDKGGNVIKNGHYDIATDYTSEDYSAPASTGTGYYIDNNQVLFLLPHKCSTDAKLIVTIYKPDESGTLLLPGSSEKYSEHTVTTTLGGDEWEQGKLLTYVLSLQKLNEGYTFTVGTESVEKEHSTVTTSGSLSFDSYASSRDYSTSNDGTAGASGQVSFSVVGYSLTDAESTDLSKKPDWLNFEAPVKASDDKSWTIGYQFTAQHYDTSRPYGNHRSTLQTNSRKTNVNLAAQDPNGNYFTSNSADRETANCYIVNRPGSYFFPMVYGNGLYIDNTSHPAERNLTAYGKKSVWIRKALEGEKTTDGDVTTQTDREYKAEVVWQDAENLVQKVDIDAQNPNNIVFEVDETNICPGNAVIALKSRSVTIKTTLKSTTKSDNGLVGTVVNKTSTSADGKTTTTEKTVTTYEGGSYTKSEVEEVIVRDALDYATTEWTWHIWVTDEVYRNRQGDPSNLISVSTLTAPDKLMPVNLGWVPATDDWGSYSLRQVWVTFKQNGSKTHKVKFTQHAKPDIIGGHSVEYQWGTPMPMPANGVTWYDANGTATVFKKDDASTQPTLFKPATPVATTAWSNTGKTLFDPSPAGFRVGSNGMWSVLSITDTSPTDGASLNLYNGYGNSEGGYFYAKEHTAALTADDRYAGYTYVPNPGMFYLPAGTYWTGSNNSETESYTLQAVPDKSTGSANWTGTAPFCTPCPLRPVGSIFNEN